MEMQGKQQQQQPTPRPPAPMSELERLERRMEKKWFDLAMAEQRNQPVHVLERMYTAYLEALDAFIQYQRRPARHGSADRLAS